MSLHEEYTPLQRLCHEVRILLALTDLEERDGPDCTGMYEFQQMRVYDVLAEIEKAAKPEAHEVEEAA